MTSQERIVRALDGIIIAVAAVLVAWAISERGSEEGATMSVGSMHLQSATARPELVRRGTRVVLPNVQWDEGVRNIVLLASATCPACNDSITFYRSLGDYTRDVPELRFVIAAADDAETIANWAGTHGIRYDVLVELRDAVLLGFTLTPTLLLVDDDGVVTDVMLGRLSTEEESILWERLRWPDSVLPLSNARYAVEIDGAEFQDLMVRSGERLVVVDVRSRSDYQRSRTRRAATNIPMDELAIRGAVELLGRPERGAVVVGCTAIHWIECRRAGRILEGMGAEDVSLLLP